MNHQVALRQLPGRGERRNLRSRDRQDGVPGGEDGIGGHGGLDQGQADWSVQQAGLSCGWDCCCELVGKSVQAGCRGREWGTGGHAPGDLDEAGEAVAQARFGEEGALPGVGEASVQRVQSELLPGRIAEG
jgi:hypothetical protein